MRTLEQENRAGWGSRMPGVWGQSHSFKQGDEDIPH